MAVIGNSATQQAFTPAVDYFSGNASTTAFTLSRPVASVAQVEAVIDNVVQNPSSAYTVSGNTITFTSAPLSGTNNIYVRYTSPITQVIAPGQGTVGNTQMASGAAVANIGAGGITANELASNSVTTTKITDANVTQAKLETLCVPLGVGQTWQNLTSSRAIGTTYTNSTGRPIMVIVSGTGNGANGLWGVTLNSAISYYTPSTYTGGAWSACEFIVPAGNTYQLTQQGSTVTLQNWSELR